MLYDMSKCDEDKLILEAQMGVPESLERVIMAYQPFLNALSKRFFVGKDERIELIQAGNLGILQALMRYNPEKECRLVTYAVPWILGEMRRTLRKLSRFGISLEKPEEETGLSLIEMIQGSAGMDVERLDLRLALKKLEGEEQRLICLRYYRNLSQKETALLLGKSQTQISRIERRALDTLKAYLS